MLSIRLKNTTLAFKSIHDLWAFKRHITISNVVVNVAAKALTAEFSVAEIESAQSLYNAIEVETTFGLFKPKADNNNNN